MINSVTENKMDAVCNLKYLTETVGGKKHLILEIMDVFLKQVPDELECINQAIAKEDYPTIKSFAHTMKSSVSIMGISTALPVLQEMEDLAVGIGHSGAHQISRIMELHQQLDSICKQAIKEIENEKLNNI